jgi:peroxiredoxin
MKHTWIAVLFPLAGLAQAKKMEGFQISGKLEGLKDSSMVVLVSGLDGKKIASVTATKGLFTLKGTLTAPDICQISFPGQNGNIDLFMNPNDKVTVSGNAANINAATVKGSVVQDDYAEFKERFNPLKDKLNGVAMKIDSEKNPARRDSLLGLFNHYKNEVIAATVRFIKEKQTSPVSGFVLFIIAPLMSSMEEVDANYGQLKPAARTTVYARQIEKNIEDARVGAVGSKAIAFTQKDTANRPVSLASFKGKYVLVDFWASWCGPCRKENPNVVKAFNTFKDRNFTVLGVSLDQNRDAWLQAIRTDGLTWTHVSDLQYWNNAVARLYNIQGIPANMLIDPDGRIIARDLREEALEEALKKILK